MTPSALLTDPARLHALRSTGLLDHAPDAALDRFTRLAGRLVGAPVALVSLVAGDRQVVRSAAGLAPSDPFRQLDLEDSFCRHAVVSGEPLVVVDAADHPLVGGSRAVRELGVRAYLGIPLFDRDGHALGTLCALDRRPHVWNDDDVAAMRDLAAAVEGEIELRRATRRAQRGAEMQAGGQRVLQMLADGIQLELVLAELARNVVRLEPHWHVAVMLLDESDQVLRPAATANVHDELQSAIEAIAIAPDGRPCGAAAYLGERIVVPELGDVPGGVRACWSTPVLSARAEVLGTFTVFRDEPGRPNTADTTLLDMAAHLAGTAIGRTRSEQRLATTARRLAQAQAIARVGSWEWERASDRVFWSDHLYELLGFPRGAPPGHEDFLAHVHPDERDDVGRTIDRAYAAGEPGYEYECRFLRPDGSVCTLFVRADIDLDEQGVAVRSSGICQDVTELRASERELEATARRLEQAQALAQIGSWEWEAETGIVRWSAQARRLFGLGGAGDQASYAEFLARVHPEDRDRVERATRDAHRGHEPGYEYECRILRPDGGVRTIHVLGEVTLDDQGRAVRSSGTAQDVTERRLTLARLAQAESLARVGSWEWSVGSEHGIWSPELFRIFGVSADSFEPTWENALARCHPDDRDQAAEHLRLALAEHDSLDVTVRILGPDDDVRWVRVRAEIVRSESGRPLRMIGTTQDLTESKRAEHSLREAEERFGSTFDESEVGMALLDPEMKRLLRVNRALCELLGRTEEALLRAAPEELRHPDDAPVDVEELRRTLRDGQRSVSSERRYLRANGETVHASVGVTLVSGADGEALYWVLRAQDITDRRRVEEQLRHQALHSPLTGLPNRTLLLDRVRHGLRQAERRGTTLALMAIDIDRFGAVNERFGLAGGDAALAALATRLASNVRPADTVAHLGGDEFLVLCEDLPDEHEALALAARFAAVVAEPLTAGDAVLTLSASIGIVLAHEGEAIAEDLIRDAESAMSLAHERGGGSWEVFDPSLRARLVDRLQLEHELRCAIERDELCLHYQPVLGIERHELDGAEALARWQHPERGLLMPADFLGVAEETGLIVPMGAWVLREACRQAAEWGPSVPKIAVNVSARQIDAPGFVDEVAGALRESGVEPTRVVIELTETGLMESGTPADTLAGLKALGVRVVLDDFGTGYSSLSHLRSFPVDGLKIDRSFVTDVAGDEQAQRIVEAIVGIGSALDITVVAEGVETEEQLDAVTRLGCDAVQGYLLGRPGPPAQLALARPE